MDEDARHWVDMAVREAVANAIKHGNAQDPAKQVHVDLVLDGRELVIRVEDEGSGFDPARRSRSVGPGEHPAPERPRHLLHEEASWTTSNTAPAPAGGTMVTLRKRIAGPKAESKTDDLGGGN